MLTSSGVGYGVAVGCTNGVQAAPMTARASNMLVKAMRLLVFKGFPFCPAVLGSSACCDYTLAPIQRQIFAKFYKFLTLSQYLANI